MAKQINTTISPITWSHQQTDGIHVSPLYTYLSLRQMLLVIQPFTYVRVSLAYLPRHSFVKSFTILLNVPRLLMAKFSTHFFLRQLFLFYRHALKTRYMYFLLIKTQRGTTNPVSGSESQFNNIRPYTLQVPHDPGNSNFFTAPQQF